MIQEHAKNHACMIGSREVSGQERWPRIFVAPWNFNFNFCLSVYMCVVNVT